MFSHVTRREASHLAIILVTGLLVRAALFNVVGIWGDFGFYIYDSRLILDGGVPFIDFIGRSPLFLYTLAGVLNVVGDEVVATRAFIIFWWFVTALPIYAVGRRLQSHTGGLAAVAVFWLLPFPIAWGMWANTQSMAAFLGLLAVWVYVRGELLAKPSTLAAVGVILGASFLVRRSSIVVLIAFVLWTVYMGIRQREFVTPTASLSAMTAAFVGTLSAMYAAMSGGSPSPFVGLWRTHAVGLVSSSGRGGFALVGESASVTRTVTSGSVPILNDICQLCGVHTAEVFSQTALVSMPALLPALVGVSALLDRLSPGDEENNFVAYLAAVIGALTLYAVYVLVLDGFWLRSISIISGAVGLALVWRVPVPDVLTTRRVQFVWLIVLGFAGGYLYRERLVHVYYFMDLYPFVSILSGISLGALLDHEQMQGSDFQTAKRVGIVVLLLTAAAGSVGAYPVTNTLLHDNDDGWFTMSSVQEFGDDIESRTSPDEQILAGMPTYVADADRQMALNRPRLHYVAAGFGTSGPGERQAERLEKAMQSGDIELVIMSPMTHNLIRYHRGATRAFEQHYCRVETGGLYETREATLYEYDKECPDERQPKVNSMFNETGVTYETAN